MKVLIVDNYYPDFLKKIETELSSNKIKDYEKIKEFIFGYCFGTSDYYSRNLSNLGLEASDLIINSHSLQYSWAQQNNRFLGLLCQVMKRLPKIKKIYAHVGNPLIMIDQIKASKPDIVYVQCIGALPPIITRQIKKHCRFLVGQIAAKLPPDSFFMNYDLILSSLPNIVEKIQSLGIKSEYFPIAFESNVWDKIKAEPLKNYAVTHIGGYGPIHNQRNQILEYAAEKTEIDFWGYGTKNLKEGSSILKRFHGEAWGLEMYRILAGSKITLTGHISEVAGDYANNMTLFEATGCGALLITDDKKNLGELFEVDKEIVTYRSAEELVEKINYYLSHEEERKKIAQAGQARTFRDHTYARRMQQLKEILEEYIETIN